MNIFPTIIDEYNYLFHKNILLVEYNIKTILYYGMY